MTWSPTGRGEVFLLFLIFALTAGALYLEWTRPRQHARTWRLLATLVIGVALAGLGVAPQWITRQPQRPSSATTAIVFTPGVSERDATWLIDSVATPHLFRLPNLEAGGRLSTIPIAQTLQQVQDQVPGLETVLIAGWGVAPEEALLGDNPPHLQLRPSPQPIGITFLRVAPQVALGNAIAVHGQSHGLEGWIVLSDPFERHDSVRVSGDTVFHLAMTPRTTGIQSLVLTDPEGGSDTVVTTVYRPTLPVLLVLEHAPSFETNALRRWYADHGGAIAIRTTMSIDRMRQEFVNLEKRPLAQMTPTILDDIDLVLIDGTTLASLNTRENRVLTEALERGLGVLFVGDPETLQTARPGTLAGNILVRQIAEIPVRQVRLDLQRLSAPKAPMTPLLADPWELTMGLGDEPLITDGTGHILASRRRIGRGFLGASLVRNPSRWRFEDDTTAFAQYWVGLLNAVAPNASNRWSFGSATLHRPGRPVRLRLTTNSLSSPMTAVIQRTELEPTDTVRLTPDPLDSSTWMSLYWPSEPGEYTVRTVEDSIPSAAFLVQHATAGQARESFRRRRASTAIAGKAGQPTRAIGEERNEARSVPIPAAGFATIFLIAVAWLWLEGRPDMRMGGDNRVPQREET